MINEELKRLEAEMAESLMRKVIMNRIEATKQKDIINAMEPLLLEANKTDAGKYQVKKIYQTLQTINTTNEKLKKHCKNNKVIEDFYTCLNTQATVAVINFFDLVGSDQKCIDKAIEEVDRYLKQKTHDIDLNIDIMDMEPRMLEIHQAREIEEHEQNAMQSPRD